MFILMKNRGLIRRRILWTKCNKLSISYRYLPRLI